MGPLDGLRVVEMAALGPAPFCGMLLADHGAEVTTVCGAGRAPFPHNPLGRSRLTLEVDLKQPAGVRRVRELAATADALIEGYRPGVMERLGLGPEPLLADNPRLVYGRVTGWGQSGPLARCAGHDINFTALSGALHAFGRAGDKPTPPLSLVGDFGGGGTLLAFSVVAAVLHARASGQGQVIDCAMTEGAAQLMAPFWGFFADGTWRDERGVNYLDTGAHYYDTYETKDGRYVSIGPLEPGFYATLRGLLGLTEDPAFDAQHDPEAWPALKARLSDLFRTRTRAEWCALLEGTDACFAPVLSLGEAALHPQHAAREAFFELEGVVQPRPAPRYSATPCATPLAPRATPPRAGA